MLASAIQCDCQHKRSFLDCEWFQMMLPQRIMMINSLGFTLQMTFNLMFCNEISLLQVITIYEIINTVIIRGKKIPKLLKFPHASINKYPIKPAKTAQVNEFRPPLEQTSTPFSPWTSNPPPTFTYRIIPLSVYLSLCPVQWSSESSAKTLTRVWDDGADTDDDGNHCHLFDSRSWTLVSKSATMRWWVEFSGEQKVKKASRGTV